ncbi:hypothetical protein WJX72_001402 [[Myrmecia] bisecta]|uniref:Uncharacterized protein n=1 Tax=[Myrmecia] bisecta TaxID=41462 RepID=A0AAW1Q3U3_9CHLO
MLQVASELSSGAVLLEDQFKGLKRREQVAVQPGPRSLKSAEVKLNQTRGTPGRQNESSPRPAMPPTIDAALTAVSDLPARERMAVLQKLASARFAASDQAGPAYCALSEADLRELDIKERAAVRASISLLMGPPTPCFLHAGAPGMMHMAMQPQNGVKGVLGVPLWPAPAARSAPSPSEAARSAAAGKAGTLADQQTLPVPFILPKPQHVLLPELLHTPENFIKVQAQYAELHRLYEELKAKRMEEVESIMEEQEKKVAAHSERAQKMADLWKKEAARQAAFAQSAGASDVKETLEKMRRDITNLNAQVLELEALGLQKDKRIAQLERQLADALRRAEPPQQAEKATQAVGLSASHPPRKSRFADELQRAQAAGSAAEVAPEPALENQQVGTQEYLPADQGQAQQAAEAAAQCKSPVQSYQDEAPPANEGQPEETPATAAPVGEGCQAVERQLQFSLASGQAEAAAQPAVSENMSLTGSEQTNDKPTMTNKALNVLVGLAAAPVANGGFTFTHAQSGFVFQIGPSDAASSFDSDGEWDEEEEVAYKPLHLGEAVQVLPGYLQSAIQFSSSQKQMLVSRIMEALSKFKQRKRGQAGH